jgi:hypothetical protein
MLDRDVQVALPVPTDPQLLCTISVVATGSHEVAVLRVEHDEDSSSWVATDRSSGLSVALSVAPHRRGSEVEAELSTDLPGASNRRVAAQLHIAADRILHRISGIATGSLAAPQRPCRDPNVLDVEVPANWVPVTETLAVPDAPGQAWTLLVSPDRPPDEAYLAQFHVPGTPDRLGRWICGIYPAGERLYGNLSKVTIHDPPGHLRVISLERNNVCERDWLLAPMDGGTRITLHVRRQRAHSDERRLVRQTLDRYQGLLMAARG